MASTKERQRKLARARAERRLQALAHQQRRKRQIYASIGASVGLVVVLLGGAWLLGGFDPAENDPAPSVAQGSCSWTLKDPGSDPNVVDVGHPETEGAPRVGTQTMTLQTNLGAIDATIDLTRAPCTAASFSHLASKDYFNDSTCTRVSDTLKVLQCGDPIGNGAGMPSYAFADEDRPATVPAVDPSASPSPGTTAKPGPYYKKGQIIMVNTGVDTNGGQFYIVTSDDNDLPAAYSIVGTVTKGMDIVDQVVKEGAVDDNGMTVPEGKPKKTITIQQLVMGQPVQPTTAPPASTPAVSPPAASTPAVSPSGS